MQQQPITQPATAEGGSDAQVNEFTTLKYVTLASNGETIAYREFGHGQKVYVFVHGNVISSLWWRPLLAHIDGAKARILALDMRGFGHSSYNAPITSIDDLADDLAHFLQQLNVVKPVIVGWSLGGAVAVAFAAKYPAVTDQFALVASASPKGYALYTNDELKGLVGEDAVAGSRGRAHITAEHGRASPKTVHMEGAYAQKNFQALKGLYSAVLFNTGDAPKSDAEFDEYVSESFLQRSYGDVVTALHNFDITPETGDGRTANITTARFLVYHGDQDLIITPASAHETVKALGATRCRLVVREKCSHSPPFAAPEHLWRCIENFALGL